MKRIISNLISGIAVLTGLSSGVSAQNADVVRLGLRQTINLAADSSLSAFRYRNLYESGYWAYRSFKANRLPSMSLNMTPARYYRDIVSRYDYDNNIDVYRSQQSYFASLGLNLTQNFDWLGGTFFVESDIDYIHNMGANKFSQFSSVPVRIGYSQQLLGYNSFKWEKRIEPVKYEKVKREYLYNMESVSENAVSLFFNLALAQAEDKLAHENLASADTLYAMGERKFKIASISQAELLTLKLDLVNAKNSVENSRISLNRANAALASFLGMDRDTHLEVELPSLPVYREIPVVEALALARENSAALLADKQGILEAESEVSRRKVENMFSASFSASVGFNQIGDNFGAAYRHLMRQDMVSVSLTIPLLDWGVRKGRYKMAVSSLNEKRISARQNEESLNEEVAMTVDDFNIRLDMIKSAQEAMDLADMAYDRTRQRFMIGKSDLSSMTLASARRQEATRNYIEALKNYWLSYYTLRKLTLYDFELGIPLSRKFDIENHVK
jgi:outer membrane protein TolC